MLPRGQEGPPVSPVSSASSRRPAPGSSFPAGSSRVTSPRGNGTGGPAPPAPARPWQTPPPRRGCSTTSRLAIRPSNSRALSRRTLTMIPSYTVCWETISSFNSIGWYLDFSGMCGGLFPRGGGAPPGNPMMLRIIAYFRPAANFFSHWQPLHLPQAPGCYNGEHPFHPQEVPMTISAIDTGSVLYFSTTSFPRSVR